MPVPVRSGSTTLSAEALHLNAILTGLKGPEVAAVVAGGTLVHLPVKYEIYRPEEPIHDIFSPSTAFCRSSLG